MDEIYWICDKIVEIYNKIVYRDNEISLNKLISRFSWKNSNLTISELLFLHAMWSAVALWFIENL